MRKLGLFISCVAIGTSGLSVMAQDQKPGGDKPQPPAGERPPRGDRPGGGGPGGGMRQQALSPEKAKAAWGAEATGVAKRIGLNEAQTKTLVTAYAAARESQGAAMDKMRQAMRDAAGDGGRPDPAEMQKKTADLNKSETEKFQKAIGGTLSAEQSTKAVAVLGAFNGQWDRAVDALLEFKLDAKRQQDVLNLIEAYIVAVSKARAGDPQDARTAMQDARENLKDALKPILSEEQLAKIEATMGGGRRPPGGQDGGGQPPRRPKGDGDNKDGGR